MDILLNDTRVDGLGVAVESVVGGCVVGDGGVESLPEGVFAEPEGFPTRVVEGRTDELVRGPVFGFAFFAAVCYL